MSRERHQRLGELFSRARRLPPGERAAFLNEACGDDPELRAEVVSLLEDDSDGPLQTARVQRWLGQVAAESLPSERAVGPYRLVSEIGYGGMGSVWLAVRADDARASFPIDPHLGELAFVVSSAL